MAEVEQNPVAPEAHDVTQKEADDCDQREGEDDALICGKTYSVDEAIEACGGVGLYQWRTYLIASLVWVFSIPLPWMVLPFIVDGIKEEWGVSPLVQGVHAAAGFIGFGTGGITFGILMDKLGRKKAWSAAMVLVALGNCGSAFCPEVVSLTACRMLTGFGIHGLMVVTNTLVAEVFPVANRGRYLAVLHIWFKVGTGIAIGLGYALGWRTLLFVTAMPAVVLFVVVWLLVPESPRFLLVNGKYDEAKAALADMAELNGAKLPEGSVERLVEAGGIEFWPRLTEMFGPSLRVVMAVTVCMSFVLNWAYYGVYVSLKDYFQDVGKSAAVGQAGYYFYLGGSVLGVLLLICFVEFMPRKLWGPLLWLSGGMSIFGFASLEMEGWMFTMLMLHGVSISACFTFLYIYLAEAFPSTHRGTGTGMALGIGRIGAATATLIGPTLAEIYPALPFYLSGGMLMLGVISAFFIPCETLGTRLNDTA